MKKFPYAIANFVTIREEDYLYIDRTAYIRTLENMSAKSFLWAHFEKGGIFQLK